MRGKSKFIAFILSGIPGLAHLYIGLKERALVFFMVTSAILFGSIGMAGLSGDGDFMIIFALAYPLIWLVALIDMFSLWKKLELRHLYNNEGVNDVEMDTTLNKKTITMALSIMPGAGHMYLGQMKKGLLIMGAFLFSVFFMGWLGISLLLFLLPLIWSYSFFDAMHTIDGSNTDLKDEEFILPNIKPEYIGYGLIGFGLLVIFERILYPMIGYEIRSYIQTSIVSLIFIVGGILILKKNKPEVEVKPTEAKGDEADEG